MKNIHGTKADRANQKMLRDMTTQVAKAKWKNGETYDAFKAHLQLVWFFDDLCATVDFLHGMSVKQIAEKYSRAALSIEEAIEFYSQPVAEWLQVMQEVKGNDYSE